MSRLIKQTNEKLKYEYENTKDNQDRAKIIDNPEYYAKLLLFNIAINKGTERGKDMERERHRRMEK